MTNISCFFVEFTGTAILAFMIIAATDNHNMAPPKGLLPLVIFLVLLGLGVALGMQTCKCFVYQWLPRTWADAINLFQRMLSIQPVTLAHASSWLLRGTDHNYIATEGNSIISNLSLRPRVPQGWQESFPSLSVNIGFGVLLLDHSSVLNSQQAFMTCSSRNIIQPIQCESCCRTFHLFAFFS